MRPTTSLSFFLSVLLSISLTTAVRDVNSNQNHDAVERRQEPSPTTSSTIGYLPNAGLLSTGTPANGNQSLTGHGPAVQPQPGDSSSTDSGNDTMSGADYNPTTSGNDTMSGSDYNATAHGSGGLEGNAYNPTANDTTSTSNSTLDNPTLYNDTSNTSLMNDTATSTTPETPPSEAEEPPLVVSTTQYRVNGHQRVLLSLTYGQSNITQLWEAHNGTLTVVPIPLNETGGKADDEGDEVSIDPMETPTTTVSGGGEPYFPIGTGNAGMGGAASNDTNAPYGGGADMMGITSGAGARPTTTPMGTPTPSSSMGYQVDAGVAGASGSPVAVVVNLDAPDVNHPGFVGPKARLKAKRFLKGGEGEVR